MGIKPIQIIHTLYQLIQAIEMTVIHPLFVRYVNTRSKIMPASRIDTGLQASYFNAALMMYFILL
jgi:hypothetical protein